MAAGQTKGHINIDLAGKAAIMQLFLSIAFYVGLAALLIVLGLGIANLARTDANQASRSNKLMRMRIFVQAIVIAILVALGALAGAFKIGF